MQMRPNVPSMHLTSPPMQASYPQSNPQCGTALTTLSVSYRSSKQQTLTLPHGCKLRGAGAGRGGGGRSGRRRTMHGRNTGGRWTVPWGRGHAGVPGQESWPWGAPNGTRRAKILLPRTWLIVSTVISIACKHGKSTRQGLEFCSEFFEEERIPSPLTF